MMMKKLTALVDGSIYAQSVCDHAAWIAQRAGMQVELVHVLGRRETSSTADLSGSLRLGARSQLLEELAELDAQRARLVSHRGRAMLDDAHTILSEAGLTDITTRLRRGDLIEAIAEIEHDASMIVIGKRGEAADFAKGHLGSNLERIVRAANRPVFVCSRALKAIETILVAYDGGRSAIKAIDHIAQSPIFTGLKITIATIGSDTAGVRDGLEDAKAKLVASGIETDTQIIDGRPDEALGNLVESQKYGMLVMGAYGHSRIRSLVIGSTTTEMVRSCRIPVLLIR